MLQGTKNLMVRALQRRYASGKQSFSENKGPFRRVDPFKNGILIPVDVVDASQNGILRPLDDVDGSKNGILEPLDAFDAF